MTVTPDADAPEPARRFGRGFGARSAGPRSVKRSLASIVLGFEVIVVFLGALVAFGLGAAPPAIALGGGAVLCLLFVATIALLRYPWSYPVGWVLQALVVASGFLVPAMFFVGALFAAMWTYCMITGTRIDNHTSEPKENP
jgi:hypothetical protein